MSGFEVEITAEELDAVLGKSTRHSSSIAPDRGAIDASLPNTHDETHFAVEVRECWERGHVGRVCGGFGEHQTKPVETVDRVCEGQDAIIDVLRRSWPEAV